VIEIAQSADYRQDRLAWYENHISPPSILKAVLRWMLSWTDLAGGPGEELGLGVKSRDVVVPEFSQRVCPRQVSNACGGQPLGAADY